MKCTLEHVFSGKLEQVYKARAIKYENKELFPDIVHSEVQLDEEKDGVHHLVRKITMKSYAPKYVDKVLPHTDYEIIEESWYNPKEKEMEMIARLNSFGSLVDFTQYVSFSQLPDGKTKREITIDTRVNIPVAGEMVEEYICSQFKKNAEKDSKIIEDYIQNNLKKRL